MCHFNKWENFSGTFRSTAEKKEEENDCLCVRVCLRLEIKKPVFNWNHSYNVWNIFRIFKFKCTAIAAEIKKLKPISWISSSDDSLIFSKKIAVFASQQLAFCCLEYCQSRCLQITILLSITPSRLSSHSPEMNGKNVFRYSQQFRWGKKSCRKAIARETKGANQFGFCRKKAKDINRLEEESDGSHRAEKQLTISQYENKVHKILYFNIAGGYAFPITFPVNNSCNWSLRHIENVNSLSVVNSRFPVFCLTIALILLLFIRSSKQIPLPFASTSSCFHFAHIIIRTPVR